MAKYAGKYRIESVRKAGYDYSKPGSYFITICTHQRKHYFGAVQSGNMHLSVAGEKAQQIWRLIPDQFEYVTLGEFIIMPNHLHGIIHLRSSEFLDDKSAKEGLKNHLTKVSEAAAEQINKEVNNQLLEPSGLITPNNAIMKSIPGNNESNITKQGGCTGSMNPMLHDSVSKIIRWYKGRSAKEIRQHTQDFKWHPKFHDHIIRNALAYNQITAYIINNPMNWEKPKF
ncbi:MAG: hypothetical protein ACK500_12270 [Flavobacteriales bacterium]|jgi:REP element-mobilizing transposase RayT